MSGIPFDQTADRDYEVLKPVGPKLRRIQAENPGPFTFMGTGTYVIGEGEVAVVDPGPRDEAHVAAILNALKGERITHILVTHTHLDHSPAAALLKEATGVATYAYGPHGSGAGPDTPVEEGGDMDFRPDVEIRHGDTVDVGGVRVSAVHTPGHTSNHICFSLDREGMLLSGDHVMAWSTSVISPPDGDMAAYKRSLRLLLEREDRVYYPAHGAPVTDPHGFVQAFLDHREAREQAIAKVLADGVETIPEMVRRIYVGLDPRLHAAAARSVLAHLVEMVDEGRASADGPATLRARYAPPGGSIG